MNSLRIRLTRRLVISFAAIAAAAASLSFPQNSKRPITHEDVWLMKRVGAPVPSPNGKWVVFSVTDPAYDEKDQTSDLWVVSIDGTTPPRRLTSTKAGESGPAWSSDSRRIAFSSKREGDDVNQIYVLDMDAAGEARKVTSLSTGARGPRWRPDGKAILFTSTVYPDAPDDASNKRISDERKARKYRARVYESFPIRYWDKWLEDTQAHLFIQQIEPISPAIDILAKSKLVGEAGFGGRQTDTGEELDAEWTPDGQSIVFASTTARNTAAYANVNTHLYLVAAGGGEPKPLTRGNNSYGRPKFRPDGKALYLVSEQRGDKVYNLDRLAMIPWPATREPSILTSTFDRSINSFEFSSDSRTVYLTAEDAGLEKIYSVAADGREVSMWLEPERGVFTELASAEGAPATTLVALWASAVNPAEVVRLDVSAKRPVPLSAFNQKRVSQIDWQPVRQFWFTAKSGKRIHNFVALPPGFDENKKYPLFVLIHGGPHSMWRDHFFTRWNYHLLARPGYVVLMTNYTGSTGFGEKFAQEIQGDPFLGPADEINQAADEAIRRYPFIAANMQAAGGASYGGHLANWLQATTSRYKCLISHAGLINLESQWGTSDSIYHREINLGGPVWEQGKVWREQNPIRFASRFRTPMLLTVGENDFRVPLNQTLENWSVLQRLRIPSRLIVFPEENHWILKGENSRFFYQELHAWLKRWLGDQAGRVN